MAARAYWKGQIRLALVSIPVEVFSAVQTGSKIRFRQIHEPSGKPINYEKVVRGIGAVDKDEIVKGYEISKNNFVLLDDEEIEAARVESRKTLELVQFVESHEIDPLYYEKPYFVVPADELAEDAYVVLRDALRKTKKVALGQISVRGKEQLIAIKPCGKGLLLEMLRYADEVKKGQAFFGEISEQKPQKELLDLATTLIEQKTAPFDAAEFHDRYADALERLIQQKAKSKGKKVLEDVEEPETGKGGNVIDLMAALKKSVGDDKPVKAPARRKKSA